MDGPFGSGESVKQELSIFDPPAVQVTHLKSQWLEVKPHNQYRGSKGNPIMIRFTKAQGWYFDFNDSYLEMNLKIVLKDGVKDEGKDMVVDAGDDSKNAKVAPINYIMAGMFKDVSLSAGNQQKIEGENQHYGYKAYLYTLLNANKAAKAYQLACAGWCHDDAGKFDLETNSGYLTRRKWVRGSAEFQVLGPIFTDLFLQPQYMIDDTDFELKLTLNPAEFVLQAYDLGVHYRIYIDDVTFWLRQVNVSPSVILGHSKGLDSQNAIYPYNGHKIFSHTYSSGGQMINHTSLLQGIFPKLVILGLVAEDAYVGTYNKSPWNFQHFDCEYVELSVNGNFIPHKPFTPNFAKGKIAREYMSLFWGLGKNGILTDDNGILLEDYKGGNALYAFALAPDLCLSGHAQPAKLAPLHIVMRFSKALPEPVRLIAFCVYDTKIEITKARMIVADPTQIAG